MQRLIGKTVSGAYWVARAWFMVFVIGLVLLTTFDRVASQNATPTPDVSTVPRPEDIFTPTNTPPPVAAPIVTATPVNPVPTPNTGSTTSGGNQPGGGSNTGSNTTAPVNGPVNAPVNTLLTPGSPQTNGGLGVGVNAPAHRDARGIEIVVQPAGSPLSMSAHLDRAFLWPGQTFTLSFVLVNLGDQPLSDLRLRHDLPSELIFQAAEYSGPGRVQQDPPADGKAPVLITWDALAAGAQVTATLTVQVAPQTANGRLIDIRAMAAAAGVAAVAADFTLVMPPAQLPQF